jgi:HK97 family phage portal protein
VLSDLFSQETRAISFQSMWASNDIPLTQTEAGAYITQENAFQIGTVYACINLISGTIATLPIDAYQRIDGNRVPYRPRPEWVQQPDIEMSRIEHFQQVLVSLLLDGNAFIRVFRKAGAIVSLVVLDPTNVRVERQAMGRLKYYFNEQEIKREDMLHIRDLVRPGALRGVSRVEELKEELGLASALRSFASRFFGQGATAQGVIEVPGNLTPEQAKSLSDSFSNRHAGFRKSHKVGVLSGGASYKATSASPEEAQMLESRRLAVEQICQLFGVSPSMIGMTTPGAMSYASVEQASLNLVRFCLQPLIQKLEEAYSNLLLGQRAFVKFNVDSLLRADYATRIAGYSSALQAGWMSINDVRSLEDMQPAEGGDVYRVPLANVNLTAADLAETDKKVAMAQKLITVGFEPASVLLALGLPDMTHTGVPSVQLQGVAQIDPEAPATVYGA